MGTEHLHEENEPIQEWNIYCVVGVTDRQGSRAVTSTYLNSPVPLFRTLAIRTSSGSHFVLVSCGVSGRRYDLLQSLMITFLKLMIFSGWNLKRALMFLVCGQNAASG